MRFLIGILLFIITSLGAGEIYHFEADASLRVLSTKSDSLMGEVIRDKSVAVSDTSFEQELMEVYFQDLAIYLAEVDPTHSVKFLSTEKVRLRHHYATLYSPFQLIPEGLNSFKILGIYSTVEVGTLGKGSIIKRWFIGLDHELVRGPTFVALGQQVLKEGEKQVPETSTQRDHTHLRNKQPRSRLDTNPDKPYRSSPWDR